MIRNKKKAINYLTMVTLTCIVVQKDKPHYCDSCYKELFCTCRGQNHYFYI